AAASRASLATRILGAKRNNTRWFSGAWTGGYMSGARAEAFGRWRGTPLDAVTTYPDKSTWSSIRDSDWHISTYDSFPGRLVYGLPLLPERGPGTLADVAKGRYDGVFRQVARDLKAKGRGNAIVRIGLEANGDWVRYGGTAKNAATWKAAYRRVAKVMKATAPKLVRDFDITCGFSMPGSKNRLDSLTKLYPGDDVVDLIGCDMYDEWQTRARTPAQWRAAIRPQRSPGLADVAAFARAHRKGMTIPEWGVAYPGRNGNGDNAFFITAMRTWMRQNADVLVLENYFNDPAGHVRSDLWGGQNPRAAAAYRKAW
ncbi:MAG: glycosyl hydrolase, partial [Micrococcales bacterium]|nr:glycosyl hydrolase [Micrococcales bacterium]